MPNTLEENMRARLERPTIVTVLCIIGFLGFANGLSRLPHLLPKLQEADGTWFAVFWVFQSVLSFAAFVGYWRMQRWGPWLFIAFAVVTYPLILTSQWIGPYLSPRLLVGPVWTAVLIYVGVKYILRPGTADSIT